MRGVRFIPTMNEGGHLFLCIQQAIFQAAVCVQDSSSEASFSRGISINTKGVSHNHKKKKSINEVDYVIIHVEYGKQHYECR